MGRRTRKQILAELEAPLPPVAETLAVLDQLATHQYDTKARTSAALKLAHRTLRELFRHIEASAAHERLIARVTADALHRDLRRSLDLDKPKRFPPLPRAPEPRIPREVIAAATPSPNAIAPERATELFSAEGIEFDPEAG